MLQAEWTMRKDDMLTHCMKEVSRKWCIQRCTILLSVLFILLSALVISCHCMKDACIDSNQRFTVLLDKSL